MAERLLYEGDNVAMCITPLVPLHWARPLGVGTLAMAVMVIAKHLKKANAKTQKFSQAEEMISALANGGSFSTDYALEEIHQCFSYGVDALH